MVSDTSYPGYRDIPLDVMHGYGVMAGEVEQRMQDTDPRHRSGRRRRHGLVSAPASGCTGARIGPALSWSSQHRRIASIKVSGQRVTVHGSLDTVMAGLACGEVSELAWGNSSGAGSMPVSQLMTPMRSMPCDVLARPVAGDAPVVAGETGGAGLAALLAAVDRGDPAYAGA